MAKKLRYSAKELPEFPTCKHSTKAFQCSTLVMRDIKNFQHCFYTSQDKVVQDAFILKYCEGTEPARRRPANGKYTSKKVHTKYFVKSNRGSRVPVCMKAFINILGITKHRVQYVVKGHLTTGMIPKKNRGEDRATQKNANKKAAVMNFINKFKCVESHYCRGKSMRMYLSSELSVNKMHRMYSEQASDTLFKVKQSYFRAVFNQNYNLGFNTPRTDVCSVCTELKEKISSSKTDIEKQNFLTQKRVHSLRAKAFFDLLKEERPGLLILSFDCQKNQVLPKVPDQAEYYSRQLYMYNFTIVEGSSKSKLGTDNVHIYYWTENSRNKGSNEISSAVFHRLSNTNLQNIDTVRLVADGCGGQNKNTTMIGMCSRRLVTAPAHIEKLEVIFPVAGHSYIPPDRVFGNIEKDLKKIEVIIEPSEYVKVFSAHGTVVELGSQECNVADWKSEVENTMKPPGSWHCQFKPSKRFLLTRRAHTNIVVQGEPYYRSNICVSRSVCRRGKTVSDINPDVLPPGVPVKALKLKDVFNLLKKHFGGEWRSLERLTYYNNLINETNPNVEVASSSDQNEVEEQNNLCEQYEEIPDMRI